MKKNYLRYPVLGFFILLVSIAVLATVVPLFPSKEWYVRVFDYPRLQTFFVAVLALIWYFVFYFKRDRVSYLFAVLLIGVISVQAYKAAPYTVLGSQQVLKSQKAASATTSVSLFICNVLQPSDNYQKVLDRVAEYQPDIVITTESDSVWQEALSVLDAKYPHRIAVPLDNTYGMHLYSKLPLDQAKVRYLLEPDLPSIRAKVQLKSGEWVHLFIVHPRPPVPGEDDDSRERDAEIIMVGREARKEKGGVIVAGDFNDVAWSETTALFQEVSGYLDPRRGRGFYNTFNAELPLFRWPLDHIFHSPHFKLIKMERGDKVGSDHFPMYIKLSYEPENADDQPKVKEEEDTQQEASKAIKKGKADAGKE